MYYYYDPQIDKPLWGAKAIAAVINRSERQTFYLLEQGRLDADKVGATWTSTIRRLLFAQSAQEARHG
jgi:hypothetical protein